jgi:hypothetical protein
MGPRGRGLSVAPLEGMVAKQDDRFEALILRSHAISAFTRVFDALGLGSS